MARTIHNENKKVQVNVEVLSSLLTRASLASKMGISFGGDRDLFNALGYPQQITCSDYLGKYKRLDIAKAVIDRPVGATWRGNLELEESDEVETTNFETEWIKLRDDLNLKSIFSRVDKLSCLGKYAVLLLGFSDTPDLMSFLTPAKQNAKLIYVRPFGEENAKINTYVTDSKSARYGLPLVYDLVVKDELSGNNQTISVHYSRVLHIVQDQLESEIEGTPKLQSIYNRLMDLEKIVGGDGEMFWRGARPGYAGKTDKEYGAGTQTEEDLTDQINEFEHNMRRILVTEGVELKGLDQQIADPKPHVDIQLQMISAVTGIPKRILTGSERGELSSAQDSEEWRAFVQERREEHAEIQIVIPFVNKMIEFKILPKPQTGKFKVVWPNAYDLNPKEKSEVGKNRAMALREYTTNLMAQAIMPPDAALKFLLALEPSEIEMIEKTMEEGLSVESESVKKYLELVKESQTTLPSQGGNKKPNNTQPNE